MLGKLLKHEFRATGRLMLPALGAVLALAVLANFSIRFIQVTDSTFLTILFGLVIAAFVIGMVAAAVMTLVLMILRFYRNLLRDEGYLMHTLPVNVHELVWSKLIVSLVWVLVTWLVICLAVFLTVLIQTGTDLGEIFASLPSWAEIRKAMAEFGIRSSDLWLLGGEFLLAMILATLASCLHFYAAMSLGHIFSKDKVLLSVVFFVAISFLFSILHTGVNVSLMINLEDASFMETAREGLRLAQNVTARGLLGELVQGGILYAITTWSLKKKLNLA
ncbi:MAG: hypothetical protein IJ179_02660 [Oscillospiraceae bacterium]|nr:hypothetical protein [Oscillospiraceae bacterium]